MREPLNRRTFLKRALALFGGIAASLSTPLSSLARPRTHTYYILDPEHGAGDECPIDAGERHAARGDCHGCRACHNHGANKIFATPEAADELRAHAHCKCLVKVGGVLPHSVWTSLFGPIHRPLALSADRRHIRTGRILASA